jgi:hypothetical protein
MARGGEGDELLRRKARGKGVQIDEPDRAADASAGEGSHE